jgi:hypothetical protein
MAEGLAADIDYRADRQVVFQRNAKSRSSWAGTAITAPSP